MTKALNFTYPEQFNDIQFYESELEQNDFKGYQSVAVNNEGVPLGTGFGSTPNQARRIAVAEALERKTFLEWRSDAEKSREWLFTTHPTTCGMAVGFKKETTRFRSLCEGLERWAWSKWIDEKHSLNLIKPHHLSPTAEFFLESFDEVRFYKKTFVNIPLATTPLSLGIVIARKGNGIYPGSRVTGTADDLWSHAAIEAYRHKLISNQEKPMSNVFYDRIDYFASHANAALNQIPPAIEATWPEPQLLLHKVVPIESGWAARTLFRDYCPWNVGSYERFVY